MQEFMPIQPSLLDPTLHALGPKYVVLLGVAALVAFLLTLIVVVRGRGPMAAAALVFIVPLPLLVGVFGALEGVMSYWSVIAASSTAPKPSELAAGIAMALVAPMAGMLLMAPSYALALLGSLVRSFLAPADRPPGAK